MNFMPNSTQPVRLISTDFDGTLFAEFANPPVPFELQVTLEELQNAGTKWAINTGRDLSSLMETMGRAHLKVKPDYIIVVEREIYRHEQSSYLDHAEWNQQCTLDHATLFKQVRKDLPDLVRWIQERFQATVYEDIYSPFCLIAETTLDAEAIHSHLDSYCASVPDLTVVRNDIYARFSHVKYNKGTALREVARLCDISVDETMAVGDHLNDLPMLKRDVARCLVAPANSIPLVKQQVLAEGGYVSSFHCGNAVLDGIRHWMK
jgi:HAD superfamily hydrolase (TIGR01484 family)